MVPIALEDYIRIHVERNPREKTSELRKRLKETLKAHQRGKRCACGEPIWVIGSAEVGHMCFTCITGSTDSSGDYEIAEACGHGSF